MGLKLGQVDVISVFEYLGIPAQFLYQVTGCPDQFVYGFDHVHRNADRSGLIGDSPCNCLADRPGSISRKLVSPLILKLVYSLHKADIAFLDEIQKLQSTIGIFFRNADNQPQIGLDEGFLGYFRLRFPLLDRGDNLLELCYDNPISWDTFFFRRLASLMITSAFLSFSRDTFSSLATCPWPLRSIRRRLQAFSSCASDMPVLSLQ